MKRLTEKAKSKNDTVHGNENCLNVEVIKWVFHRIPHWIAVGEVTAVESRVRVIPPNRIKRKSPVVVRWGVIFQSLHLFEFFFLSLSISKCC